MRRPFWPTLWGLLEDERGVLSSKRVVGVSSSFVLMVAFVLAAFLPPLLHACGGPAVEIKVDPVLAEAVTWLAIGGLGFATIDKFNPRARAEADVAKARATQEMRAMPEGG